eukprot:gene18546-23696_t
MIESINSEILINGFELPVVELFVKYLYSDKCAESNLTLYGEQLLKIAHMYDVQGLFCMTQNYLALTLAKGNVVDRLLSADTYSAKYLLD